MTIATTASAQTVLGNSSSTAFSFDFVGVSAGYISVVYTDTTGASSSISPSLYSLALNAPLTNALWGVGGTLTYPLTGSAIPSGSSLTITRTLPDVQLTTIRNQGAMWPTVVEKALDYLTMLSQQTLQTVLDIEDRSYKVPLNEAGVAQTVVPGSASRAGNLFGWDASGNPVAVAGGISTVLVSSFMQPALLLTNSATFKSYMSISTGITASSFMEPLLQSADAQEFEEGLGLGSTLSLTAAHLISASDIGKQIVAGGTNYYTISASAATNYAANFWTVIRNNDTARGKLISVSGITSFILWPQQTVTLRRSGSTWGLDPQRQKWLHDGGVTFYVATDGNNTNDGLHPSASFAGIQFALDLVREQVQVQGGTITIQLDDGTYPLTTGLNVYGDSGCPGQYILLLGNDTTPDSVILRCNPGVVCVDVQDYGLLALRGIRFETVGNASTAINCRQLAIVDVDHCHFTGFPLGNVINVTTNASLSIAGGTSVSGNFVAFINCVNNSHVNLAQGVTMSCASTTFTAFAVAANCGVIDVAASTTFTGAGAGAGSTGARYAVGTNGVLTLAGVTLPGDTAGTTATGGVVTA